MSALPCPPPVPQSLSLFSLDALFSLACDSRFRCFSSFSFSVCLFSRFLFHIFPVLPRFSRFSPVVSPGFILLLPPSSCSLVLPPVCSLSLFHFSIVEGKIIYLSATFLSCFPSAGRSYMSVLHSPIARRRRSLGSFSPVSRKRYVSCRGPCPKTPRLLQFIYSRLRRVNNGRSCVEHF